MPLLGERVDSHRFLPQVMDQGAAAVLTSQELMLPEGRGRLRRDPGGGYEKGAAEDRILSAGPSDPCRWWALPEAWERPQPGR